MNHNLILILPDYKFLWFVTTTNLFCATTVCELYYYEQLADYWNWRLYKYHYFFEKNSFSTRCQWYDL